ncbi:MAG: hypothetical protein ACP5OH_03125 [Nitrososphaerota archaeon]
MSTKGKSRSTKGKSIKPRESNDQQSGIKVGGELGVEESGRTLGKLKAGAEVGVEDDDKGSGNLQAGANIGLETDALDDVKHVADDTFDNIKSGLKAARKKLSHLYDK